MGEVIDLYGIVRKTETNGKAIHYKGLAVVFLHTPNSTQNLKHMYASPIRCTQYTEHSNRER